MLFKKKILLIFLIISSLLCKAQFYFDFEESNSFYKKKAIIQFTGWRKETIVVKQLKNKTPEDSFRIMVINYDHLGRQISTYAGSKWSPITIKDTTKYDGSGKQTLISYWDIPEDMIKGRTKNFGKQYDLSDTIQNGNFRYEYDSVNRVKKIFHKKGGPKEVLEKLIFFDGQGKIIKVDYAPESEVVYYTDYHYKNDKLKIYTVSKNGKSCNERIFFNDNGQVIKREVDFTKLGQWVTNTYSFTYTEDGLLKTEKKISDGKSYTEVIHYYLKKE